MLLDDLLQRAVQLLLLLLEELLLLQEPREEAEEEKKRRGSEGTKGELKYRGISKGGENRIGIDGEQSETRDILFQRDRRTERETKRR